MGSIDDVLVRPSLAGVCAAGLITLAGCATPTAPGTLNAVSPSPSATHAPAPTTEVLVPAVHPQCNHGAEILRYLATGDNGGDPGLDEQFAGDVGVPAPQARRLADNWITHCDQTASSADASAASASSEAAAEASASAAAVSASAAAAYFEERAASVCAAAGGHLSPIEPVDCISNSHTAACGGETLTVEHDFVLGPPDRLANDRAAGCFH